MAQAMLCLLATPMMSPFFPVSSMGTVLLPAYGRCSAIQAVKRLVQSFTDRPVRPFRPEPVLGDPLCSWYL